MAFRQTHILAQNLIFPHTLFQEQKQCEKTSDKIILSIFFFFQKSKLNISLGSQSCTSRLFNSFLAPPFTSFSGCSQKDGYTYSACVLENDSCLSTLQCLPDPLSVCFSSGWGSPKHLPGLIWEGAPCSSPSTNWLTLGEDISTDMVLKYRPRESGTNATAVIQVVRHCLFMANSPLGGCRRLQPMLDFTGGEQSSSPVINPVGLRRSHKP